MDEALICSGFFQETSKYSAGSDFDLTKHRSSTPIKVTMIGLYTYTWNQQYSTFLNKLVAANCAAHLTVIPKRIKGMQWHAKVFIAKKAATPVVGIIGSSNITRRAFAEFKDFNYECDVVFWEETIQEIDGAINGAIEGGNGFSDVVVTNYDVSHPANNRSLEDRLIQLENEILTEAIDA